MKLTKQFQHRIAPAQTTISLKIITVHLFWQVNKQRDYQQKEVKPVFHHDDGKPMEFLGRIFLICISCSFYITNSINSLEVNSNYLFLSHVLFSTRVFVFYRASYLNYLYIFIFRCYIKMYCCCTRLLQNTTNYISLSSPIKRF